MPLEIVDQRRWSGTRVREGIDLDKTVTRCHTWLSYGNAQQTPSRTNSDRPTEIYVVYVINQQSTLVWIWRWLNDATSCYVLQLYYKNTKNLD